MITPADLEDLTNVSTVDRVYDELMLHGLDAFRTATKDGQSKVFSKICHNLIQQYVEWNDYVHSNNIMQLYKDTVLVSEQTKKPSWFIRYEIIIYGRRIPLYFIDNPRALFDRMNTVFSRAKDIQNTKLTGAVVSLCNYYNVNFLSKNVSTEDKNLVISHINNFFAKEYALTDKSLFTDEVKKAIGDIIDYAKNPSAYIMPGIPVNTVDLWDEDDEEEELKPTPYIPQDVEPVIDSDSEFKYLEGKTIKFLGNIKSSLIAYIKWLAKTYNFEADITSDYDKITNLDFRKFRYSDKYAAIIAGPMPHSVKGKGDYSSGLEMLKNEPGYPDVVECVTSEKLKVTRTSINKALQEVNYKLMSR